MVTFGLVLIGLALALFVVAMIGAILHDRGRRHAIDDASVSWFEMIMAALRRPIAMLTRAGVLWFKRVAALAEIFFIIGIVLALGSAIFGDSDGEEESPDTTIAVTTTVGS